MTLTEDRGALKRFRHRGWKFQQTFITPNENGKPPSLKPFASIIVSACESIESASLIIDGAIFDPKHLLALQSKYAMPPSYGHGVSLTASDPSELGALLEAPLSDWLDFVFLPKPASFGLYADHDFYSTFFVSTRSNLNRVVIGLERHGFDTVRGWERRL